MKKTLSLTATLLLLLAIALPFFLIPALAASHYGVPSTRLSLTQRFQYAAKILWHDSTIQRPADVYGAEQAFTLTSGESPYFIAARLEEQGLIRDDEAFITYLVYTGMDTNLLPGDYRLSPSLTIPGIAGMLQDTRASFVEFIVLPGWRMEEVAASLPTSGLTITPEDFLNAAQYPPTALDVGAAASEGFLFPDTYPLPRDLNADELVSLLTQNFSFHITPEIKAGLAAQGLSFYDGVKLASIVEREAVIADERATIASVFLNRLRAGQKLETDPTIQYALGYNEFNQSWWKSPLTYADLEVNSPYNTYIYAGLPPTPICNPSLGSLEAVAFPAETPYFYFRARCDGSGLHAFAETFAGHLANGCE
ncbi:MAG: endolytic transglycosylase MltG [Anaerolineae bacterium]|jgi:UPF0755 protein|nr:endolytic transglycosylase MltG [Anaerolineae bacterium]MBT7070398.1 endolytic transglycosylase MltG [Anaerolineae bacterium]MBT7324440.1 endolytic transglycosylase MltG [Anaerolineae bacterium]